MSGRLAVAVGVHLSTAIRVRTFTTGPFWDL